MDAHLARLAARQHGLVTLAQLFAAGLSETGIRKRVARGVLHRVHRGVYAVGHAALSRHGHFMAAVLAAGEGAALSHLAVAELHGLRRHPASLIAVVAPARRRLTGVRVHTYRQLDSRDVTTHKHIRVTTVSRMLVDLTDELSPDELTNVIHEAEFRGLFSEPATRDAMARANGRRNLHVLEEALALTEAGSAGSKSRNESAFLSMLTDFPKPLPNVKVLGFEVDALWPDLKVVVEIDGPGHSRARTRNADRRRDRALRDAGYTVLRFTDEELATAPERVVRRLAARVPRRRAAGPPSALHGPRQP